MPMAQSLVYPTSLIARSRIENCDYAGALARAYNDVVADTLRELGLHVVVMQVDELIPVAHGAVAGSFADVHKHRLPPEVFAAVQAADLIFDYTTSSRGATKYNLDFHILATHYGKHI